jgi:periplasmic protein CpxP/Spy
MDSDMRQHQGNGTGNDDIDGPSDGAARPPRARGRWVPSRRRLGIALALALGGVGVSLGVAGGVAQAGFFGDEGGPGPHRGGGEGFMMRRIDRMLDAANATNDQRTKIRAIWEGFQPQIKAARQQHGGIRRQLAQTLGAATIDRARIEELRKQQVQSVDKLSSLATQAVIASAEVLTPEQRQKVLQEMARHHFHRGGGRGPGSGAGSAQ